LAAVPSLNARSKATQNDDHKAAMVCLSKPDSVGLMGRGQ
jgi:hypothetical protein